MVEFQPEGVLFVRPFLAVTTGIVVLFVGKALARRFALLREFNIPEPVTGGLLFAAAFWLVYLVSGYRVTFELTARDVLLVYFFTTIGINARVGDLKAGGRPLVLLLAAVAVFMVLQNALGIAVATLVGQPPAIGVLAGSVSLLGGHGTAIAWAPTFAEQNGIPNALEIGVLCATVGLVLASVAGGPLARFLVHRLPAGRPGRRGARRRRALRRGPARHRLLLVPARDPRDPRLRGHRHPRPPVAGKRGLQAAALRALPARRHRAHQPAAARRAARSPGRAATPALALIAEVSLGVFLAMSLMSMQLWALADLAGPLFAELSLQLVLALLFALLVVFRVLGRNYDAAVISAGFIGFGLGATPTAMANMTAVTQRHGASHVAFLVVPLVGAFFIDLLNTVVIRLFLAAL